MCLTRSRILNSRSFGQGWAESSLRCTDCVAGELTLQSVRRGKELHECVWKLLFYYLLMQAIVF